MSSSARRKYPSSGDASVESDVAGEMARSGSRGLAAPPCSTRIPDPIPPALPLSLHCFEGGRSWSGTTLGSGIDI